MKIEVLQGIDSTYLYVEDLEQEVLTEAEFNAIQAEKSVNGFSEC
jgi:hypothetical protein